MAESIQTSVAAKSDGASAVRALSEKSIGHVALTGNLASGISLCSFWLSGTLYGLDTALVGEVITADNMIAVPKAKQGVMGLLSLRGTPVVMIDTAYVLGFTQELVAPHAAMQALILRTNRTFAALYVSKLDAVHPWASVDLIESTQTHEHKAVAGIVSLANIRRENQFITLIDGTFLFQTLDQMKFR